MKKIIDRKEEVKIREISVTVCDSCGKETDSFHEWFHHSYYQEIITIKHKEGEDYFSNGSGTEIEFDICPDCWKNIVLPFMNEITHNKVKYKEWDW